MRYAERGPCRWQCPSEEEEAVNRALGCGVILEHQFLHTLIAHILSLFAGFFLIRLVPVPVVRSKSVGLGSRLGAIWFSHFKFSLEQWFSIDPFSLTATIVDGLIFCR